MKNFILIIVLSLAIVGCGTLTGKNQGVLGKASKAEDKQKAKVEMVDASINVVATEKLDHIGQLSSGTDYALTKATNQEPAVQVAKEINERVISLANKPTIEQVKEIQAMVDGLMENNKKAIKALNEKDEIISALMDEEKVLFKKKDLEIKKYMQVASDNASLADQYKATLQEMDSFFGLGAVKYGITKFIKSAMWFMIGFGVLFIVLRIFASSNPIVGAIFSVFESILGAFIKAIAFLAPKAINFAGLIAQKTYDTTAETLSKVVNTIEQARTVEKSTGQVVSQSSLKTALSQTMDETHKNVIIKLKNGTGDGSVISAVSIPVPTTPPISGSVTTLG